MLRRFRVCALALPVLMAAGCQDYNFNPVGHCLISTANKRVTLSTVTTADVLFVVDDSGSMAGEQAKLGQNFQAFIANLDATNLTRVAKGLEPIDFHVAVTTTSIFYNWYASGSYCSNSCGSQSGSLVCCNSSSQPVMDVQRCTGASDASCTAGSCRQTCTDHVGEWVCCDDTLKPAENQPITCATEGEACGRLQTYYRVDGSCSSTPGNAADGHVYPHGSFVGYQANPRVLHFDKSLYTCGTSDCRNSQGLTTAQLQAAFATLSGSGYVGNVIAGTCGSGQEQGLEAAKLAVQKALAGSQLDTCDASGTCGTAAQYPAQWLHDNSKLVLVFVGDEDDCSSPESASQGVIMGPRDTPGDDSCTADQLAQASGATGKEYAVASFIDYFTGLGKDLGAAFIVSASQTTCQDSACTPGVCTDSDATCTDTSVCGGQASGTRLLEAYSQLQAAGADVVAGSVCDGDFATILDRIAEIVKPPSGLMLPSQPASTDVSLLRIASAAGKTRKTCNGPAPVGLSAADAADQGYDWWFTASREQLTATQLLPTVASRFVYINHATANCEADAGETYSVDYIARLPSSGCQTDDECVSALGGADGDFTCFAGLEGGGACTTPTSSAPGTCICGARADNCPNG